MKRHVHSHSLRPDAKKSAPSPMANGHRISAHYPDDIWDVFTLDEENMEPEPEPGDFWGEVEADDWD